MNHHHWIDQSVIYAIYPLGFCGAPLSNDFLSAPQPRIQKLLDWSDHLTDLGVNTLSLGPLFESSRHGYDTADYFQIDRRLGTRQQFAELCGELHRRGFRIMLDGVFNHVGRDFWAFRDMCSRPESSDYSQWFAGLQLGKRSPYGDPFWYEGWNNHFELVKLNLQNPRVRDHLFQAAACWMDEFKIDGLRLDAANNLDRDFIHDLAAFCRQKQADFWMWGEILHGDYNQWAGPGMLDSVTNYECYKGLYSSLNDQNYFEIAYALNRQSGPDGLYRDLRLYNFADNHDVNRVASDLKNKAHLYPLYILLFCMPGVPAIYYGSEWGLSARRTAYSDLALRPCLDLPRAVSNAPEPHLAGVLNRLIAIRKNSPALQYGDYRQLLVKPQQFAFSRHLPEETILVILNAANSAVEISLPVPDSKKSDGVDLLDQGEVLPSEKEELLITIPPSWGRILKFQ